MKGNRTNHPRKWMRWDDWENWLLKEWYPFKTNDLPHLLQDINNIKRDMWWQKTILIGILLALVSAALAIVLIR